LVRDTAFGAKIFRGAPGWERKVEEGSVFIDTAVEGERYVSLRGTGAILMEDENTIWMSQVKSRREWEKLRWSGCFDFICKLSEGVCPCK
jgi:hypothetical protein